MLARKITWTLVAATGIVALSGRWHLRADEPAGISTTKASAKVSTKVDDRSLVPKDAQAATSDSPAAGSKKPRIPITENEGIIHGETPNYPRVLFITTKDSPNCDTVLARLRKPGGDFENMRAAGWTIGETADNNIQIVDRDLIPELAEKLKIHEYPAVACIGKGKVVRSFKSGCTTPLDAWTFGWLAKGIDERPTAPVLEAATVETTGHYPLRGNHWSVSGDWNPTREEVVAHLRGPNHAAEILASQQIETWSLEELRSLHDDLHEHEPGYNPYASQGTPDPSVHRSKGEVR
jgi:hypothetical protein